MEGQDQNQFDLQHYFTFHPRQGKAERRRYTNGGDRVFNAFVKTPDGLVCRILFCVSDAPMHDARHTAIRSGVVFVGR